MECYEFGSDMSMYDAEQLQEIKDTLLTEVKIIDYLLSDIATNINNHIYDTLKMAERALMDIFDNNAFEDCEGAGNVGDGSYTQDFIVDGVTYIGIGTYEYDRHDKQYYYIDSSEWSYEPKLK
jgi:hypothetical protein